MNELVLRYVILHLTSANFNSNVHEHVQERLVIPFDFEEALRGLWSDSSLNQD